VQTTEIDLFGKKNTHQGVFILRKVTLASNNFFAGKERRELH